jgi:DNA-binding response OmpR family regulator
MRHILAISKHPQIVQPLAQVLKKRGLDVKIVLPPDWETVELALYEQGDQVHETIILLDCDSAAHPTAHKKWLDYLRNQLYRCPVIVLRQPELDRSFNQPDLWFVIKPPKLEIIDIALEEIIPYSVESLSERVERLIAASARELERLQWKLEGTLDNLSLMEKVEHVANQARREPALHQNPAVRKWLDAAQALADALRLPQAVPMENIRNFTSTLPQAEYTARQLSEYGAKWAGELHKLNSAVRSLAWAQGWSIHIGALLKLLTPLAQRGTPYRDLLASAGADKLLNTFYEELRAIPANNREQTIVTAKLRSLCDTHRDAISAVVEWANKWEASRLSPPVAEGEQAAYQQVIIVEDDEVWREKMILPLLRREFPNLNLLMAKDYPEARRLIEASNQPSIVLVDIGLPPAIEDYLGLKLLEEFAAARPQDRYIVLTAAEDYLNFVRHASLTGVNSHDYILKHPDYWEAEITTRINAALQPRSKRHRIEVYAYTGRWISIDGVEIELERKPFRLFNFLAHNSQQKWTAEEIIDEVTDAIYEEFEIFENPGEGTPQLIVSYVHDIRQAIEEAFKAVQQPIDRYEVINTDSDTEETRYYLTSRPIIYETFEEIPQTPPRLPVLVVEDDPQYAQAIVNALTVKGLPCETAGSVTEAKQKIDALTPQVVTLDLMLPRVQGEPAEEPLGMEVLTYLKQRVSESKAAVLTSIEWQDAVKLKILQTGIHILNYLSKTWDGAIDRLVKLVWRLVVELEHSLTFATTEEPSILYPVQLDDAQPGLVWINGIRVKLPKSHYKLLRVLAKARNTPLGQKFLIDHLWLDLPSDKKPVNPDNALSKKMSQLKKYLRERTQNQIDPDYLIRSYEGSYCLLQSNV